MLITVPPETGFGGGEDWWGDFDWEQTVRNLGKQGVASIEVSSTPDAMSIYAAAHSEAHDDLLLKRYVMVPVAGNLIMKPHRPIHSAHYS